MSWRRRREREAGGETWVRGLVTVWGVPGSAGLVPAQEARHGSHVLGHPRSHQLNSLKQPQHEQQLCEEEHRQDIIDTQDTTNFTTFKWFIKLIRMWHSLFLSKEH